MSNNKIENISNSIKGKKYLTILDLEYNCIRDVPGFVFRLENLGVLKINNNLIEEIGNP